MKVFLLVLVSITWYSCIYAAETQHGDYTEYGTTTQLNSTTNELDSTSKQSSAWYLHKKAENLSEENKKFAIDTIVEAFQKYKETEYYDLALHVVEAFAKKYKSLRWAGTAGKFGTYRSYGYFKGDNFMSFRNNANGMIVEIWESYDKDTE